MPAVIRHARLRHAAVAGERAPDSALCDYTRPASPDMKLTAPNSKRAPVNCPECLRALATWAA